MNRIVLNREEHENQIRERNPNPNETMNPTVWPAWLRTAKEVTTATLLAGPGSVASGRVLLGARAVEDETAAATVLDLFFATARAREKGVVC
jgi:hypothetical protein